MFNRSNRRVSQRVIIILISALHHLRDQRLHVFYHNDYIVAGTLANRLRNKGELLASKNQNKSENEQEVYIPSALSKEKERELTRRESNNLNVPGDNYESDSDSY